MNRFVIEARDLHLGYGKKAILHLPAFHLAAGEVLAVLGRNGTGKTTLLKACLGLHPPIAGQMRLLGQTVSELRPWQRLRLRRRIGYVPQATAGTSEVPLTVREVVAMGRTALAGLFQPLRRNDWQLVDMWLDRLALTHLASRPFRQTSGGEQRKTLLARAMVQQPDILLLDEPTAWLDLGWREQIVQWLEVLYQQTHVAIVLVCHELEVLPPSCRRVVLLDKGTLAACGSPEDVLTDERVCAFYEGRFRAIHHAGRHAVLPIPGGTP
jgi:iron complex transport system ATP-binding protein